LLTLGYISKYFCGTTCGKCGLCLTHAATGTLHEHHTNKSGRQWRPRRLRPQARGRWRGMGIRHAHAHGQEEGLAPAGTHPGLREGLQRPYTPGRDPAVWVVVIPEVGSHRSGGGACVVQDGVVIGAPRGAKPLPTAKPLPPAGKPSTVPQTFAHPSCRTTATARRDSLSFLQAACPVQ
jgi:hypothetical protein